VGRYRDVAKEVLNSAEIVVYNKKLKLSIKNSKISCSYNYCITKDSVHG
jgi:hypothetical protein